ncbi:MAG: Methyltransferase type 11 [Gemmatimonadetes bacterium]|nr:Methyltransferase type 11 [Gemmatimonadota bacterium]
MVPARRRGFEHLDDASVPDDVRLASMRDVMRSNTVFGGARAVMVELERVLPQLGPSATMLDIGTGLGDIPERAAQLAAGRGVQLRVIGLDGSEPLLRAGRSRMAESVRGDALRLPFASGSVDVVTCSQVLHHFEEPELGQLLAEMHRVARVRAIVSDLRRSWVAVAGFWPATFLLAFHRVTRHDGITSILRGFTPGELGALVQRATGATPRVATRLGWRVTASWSPPEQEEEPR